MNLIEQLLGRKGFDSWSAEQIVGTDNLWKAVIERDGCKMESIGLSYEGALRAAYTDFNIFVKQI